MTRFGKLFGAMTIAGLAGIAAAMLGLATPAQAACSTFMLACEDGRSYPFCPLAVSPAGDVVTGLLQVRPRHSVHLRLIPMGAGYRYAGRGIWFDGQHEIAELNWGLRARTACTVTRGDGAPAVLVTKG